MSNATPKSGQFICPYCGTKNPPYDFMPDVWGDLQMRVQFVTVVCGGTIAIPHFGQGLLQDEEKVPCRRILSVCILACEISRVPVLGG